MGSWATRFEAVISEIDGVNPPSDERKRFLREIYLSSLWESLRDLSRDYRSGMIDQEVFDTKFLDLVRCNEQIEQSIEKVNFYEEL